MDIHCPTCGEPWDSYHMRNDEPHEWGLSKRETQRFIENSARFIGPDDPALMAAQAAGWRFASHSVLSFTRCPSCARATPLRDAIERRSMVAAMAGVLADDEDALTSELVDMEMYLDRGGDRA